MPKPVWAQQRWLLGLEAYCWRFLMDIGMSLHRLAPPRPNRPSFTRNIPSTLSERHPGGDIKLVFYVPPDYGSGKRYPVMVNFHGGGFTIGKPEDDATWATAAVKLSDVVVVSVGYRLAPRYYFPTPVEDGADAVLYLIKHAESLHLDPMQIITSGFSAGGNLCFTVPLKLASLKSPTSSTLATANNSTESLTAVDRRSDKVPRDQHPTHQNELTPTTTAAPIPTYQILAIIAFYPSVNFTNTRTERRASNIRQDRNLAEFFTDLFDASYLFPANCSMDHPFLSPGAAPDSLLRTLPRHIHFYTAEWDELEAEARAFEIRLAAIGCKTRYKQLKGQVHAWDRGTNPLRENKLRGLVYAEATTALSRILSGVEADEESGEERVSGLHVTEEVNEVMETYVRKKDLSKVVGADTPQRPGTPEMHPEEGLVIPESKG